jgi:N-acetyllactosaminide beta-1,3-N-acetylglucosaminyltransferase
MVLSDFILSTRRTEPRSEVLSRVTLCTQTYDLKLLQEYLPEVVERWAGPVSLAIYAPHNDFYVALQAISYLRQCSSPGIKTWVTVHFIFDLEFWPGLPKAYHSLLSMKAEEWDDPAICNNKNSNNNNKSWTPSYRQQAGLSYPINIARNVARTRAYTYHILETELHFLLFPTNLEPKFVKLIKSLQPNRNMRSVSYHLHISYYHTQVGSSSLQAVTVSKVT